MLVLQWQCLLHRCGYNRDIDRSLFGGYNGAVSALLLNQNFHRIVTNDEGQHGNNSLKENFYGDLDQLKKALNLYR